MADYIKLGETTICLPLESDGAHVLGSGRYVFGRLHPPELAQLAVAAPELLLAAEAAVQLCRDRVKHPRDIIDGVEKLLKAAIETARKPL